MCRSNNLLSDFVRYVDCNISNISPILKGLLSLARRVEITTDPDQEAVPACDLLRGNATCDVDIVITPPRVHIGLWHCVHIVILPLCLSYWSIAWTLATYRLQLYLHSQGNANIWCCFSQRFFSKVVFWLTLLISIGNAKGRLIQHISLVVCFSLSPMATPLTKAVGECPNRSQDYLPWFPWGAARALIIFLITLYSAHT